MSFKRICEQCKKQIDVPVSGVPSGWTFLMFCSIPCLTAWKKVRFTVQALADS